MHQLDREKAQLERERWERGRWKRAGLSLLIGVIAMFIFVIMESGLAVFAFFMTIYAIIIAFVADD